MLRRIGIRKSHKKKSKEQGISNEGLEEDHQTVSDSPVNVSRHAFALSPKAKKKRAKSPFEPYKEGFWNKLLHRKHLEQVDKGKGQDKWMNIGKAETSQDDSLLSAGKRVSLASHSTGDVDWQRIGTGINRELPEILMVSQTLSLPKSASEQKNIFQEQEFQDYFQGGGSSDLHPSDFPVHVIVHKENVMQNRPKSWDGVLTDSREFSGRPSQINCDNFDPHTSGHDTSLSTSHHSCRMCIFRKRKREDNLRRKKLQHRKAKSVHAHPSVEEVVGESNIKFHCSDLPPRTRMSSSHVVTAEGAYRDFKEVLDDHSLAELDLNDVGEQSSAQRKNMNFLKKFQQSLSSLSNVPYYTEQKTFTNDLLVDDDECVTGMHAVQDLSDSAALASGNDRKSFDDVYVEDLRIVNVLVGSPKEVYQKSETTDDVKHNGAILEDVAFCNQNMETISLSSDTSVIRVSPNVSESAKHFYGKYSEPEDKQHVSYVDQCVGTSSVLGENFKNDEELTEIFMPKETVNACSVGTLTSLISTGSELEFDFENDVYLREDYVEDSDHTREGFAELIPEDEYLFHSRDFQSFSLHTELTCSDVSKSQATEDKVVPSSRKKPEHFSKQLLSRNIRQAASPVPDNDSSYFFVPNLQKKVSVLNKRPNYSQDELPTPISYFGFPCWQEPDDVNSSHFLPSDISCGTPQETAISSLRNVDIYTRTSSFANQRTCLSAQPSRLPVNRSHDVIDHSLHSSYNNYIDSLAKGTVSEANICERTKDASLSQEKEVATVGRDVEKNVQIMVQMICDAKEADLTMNLSKAAAESCELIHTDHKTMDDLETEQQVSPTCRMVACPPTEKEALLRRIKTLEAELADARQTASQARVNSNTLQEELSRTLGGELLKERLKKELENERTLRIEAEYRMQEMATDNDRCKTRLDMLQDEFNNMEDVIKQLMQCKGKIDELQQEKAVLIQEHQGVTQQLRTQISQTEQENSSLRNEVKRMEALLSALGESEQDGEEETGAVSDQGKFRALVERLKALEQQNSNLMVESEKQRVEYERCLDEIANQVVQAVMAQKSLRTECIKLQQRVWDLEKQNKMLSLLLQSRLKSASTQGTTNDHSPTAARSPSHDQLALSSILPQVSQCNIRSGKSLSPAEQLVLLLNAQSGQKSSSEKPVDSDLFLQLLNCQDAADQRPFASQLVSHFLPNGKQESLPNTQKIPPDIKDKQQYQITNDAQESYLNGPSNNSSCSLYNTRSALPVSRTVPPFRDDGPVSMSSPRPNRQSSQLTDSLTEKSQVNPTRDDKPVVMRKPKVAQDPIAKLHEMDLDFYSNDEVCNYADQSQEKTEDNKPNENIAQFKRMQEILNFHASGIFKHSDPDTSVGAELLKLSDSFNSGNSDGAQQEKKHALKTDRSSLLQNYNNLSLSLSELIGSTSYSFDEGDNIISEDASTADSASLSSQLQTLMDTMKYVQSTVDGISESSTNEQSSDIQTDRLFVPDEMLASNEGKYSPTSDVNLPNIHVSPDKKPAASLHQKLLQSNESPTYQAANSEIVTSVVKNGEIFVCSESRRHSLGDKDSNIPYECLEQPCPTRPNSLVIGGPSEEQVERGGSEHVDAKSDQHSKEDETNTPTPTNSSKSTVSFHSEGKSNVGKPSDSLVIEKSACTDNASNKQPESAFESIVDDAGNKDPISAVIISSTDLKNSNQNVSCSSEATNSIASQRKDESDPVQDIKQSPSSGSATSSDASPNEGVTFQIEQEAKKRRSGLVEEATVNSPSGENQTSSANAAKPVHREYVVNCAYDVVTGSSAVITGSVKSITGETKSSVLSPIDHVGQFIGSRDEGYSTMSSRSSDMTESRSVDGASSRSPLQSPVRKREVVEGNVNSIEEDCNTVKRITDSWEVYRVNDPLCQDLSSPKRSSSSPRSSIHIGSHPSSPVKTVSSPKLVHSPKRFFTSPQRNSDVTAGAKFIHSLPDHHEEQILSVTDDGSHHMSYVEQEGPQYPRLASPTIVPRYVKRKSNSLPGHYGRGRAICINLNEYKSSSLDDLVGGDDSSTCDSDSSFGSNKSTERVRQLCKVFEPDGEADSVCHSESLNTVSPGDTDNSYQHNSYPPYSRSVKRKTRTCTQIISLSSDDNSQVIAVSKYKGAKTAMGINGLITKWKHERLINSDSNLSDLTPDTSVLYGSPDSSTSSVIPPYVPASSDYLGTGDWHQVERNRSLTKKNSLPTTWEIDELEPAPETHSETVRNNINDMANSVPTCWMYSEPQLPPMSRKYSLPEKLSDVKKAQTASELKNKSSLFNKHISAPGRIPPHGNAASVDKTTKPSTLSHLPSSEPTSEALPSSVQAKAAKGLFGNRTTLPGLVNKEKSFEKKPSATTTSKNKYFNLSPRKSQPVTSGTDSLLGNDDQNLIPPSKAIRERHSSGSKSCASQLHTSIPSKLPISGSQTQKQVPWRSPLPSISTTNPPCSNAPERPASTTGFDEDDLAAFGDEAAVKLLTPSEDESEGDMSGDRRDRLSPPEHARAISTPASSLKQPSAANSVNINVNDCLDSVLSDDSSDISIDDINVNYTDVWKNTGEKSLLSYGNGKEVTDCAQDKTDDNHSWNLEEGHGKLSPPNKDINNLLKNEDLSPVRSNKSGDYSIITMTDLNCTVGSTEGNGKSSSSESWVNISDPRSPTHSSQTDSTSTLQDLSPDGTSSEHVGQTNTSFSDMSTDIAVVNNNNYMLDLNVSEEIRDDSGRPHVDCEQALPSRKDVAESDNEKDDEVPSPSSNGSSSFELIPSDFIINSSTEFNENETQEKSSMKNKDKFKIVSPKSKLAKPASSLSTSAKLGDSRNSLKPVGKVLPNLHNVPDTEITNAAEKFVLKTVGDNATDMSPSESKAVTQAASGHFTSHLPSKVTCKSKLPTAFSQPCTSPKRQLALKPTDKNLPSNGQTSFSASARTQSALSPPRSPIRKSDVVVPPRSPTKKPSEFKRLSPSPSPIKSFTPDSSESPKTSHSPFRAQSANQSPGGRSITSPSRMRTPDSSSCFKLEKGSRKEGTGNSLNSPQNVRSHIASLKQFSQRTAAQTTRDSPEKSMSSQSRRPASPLAQASSDGVDSVIQSHLRNSPSTSPVRSTPSPQASECVLDTTPKLIKKGIPKPAIKQNRLNKSPSVSKSTENGVVKSRLPGLKSGDFNKQFPTISSPHLTRPPLKSGTATNVMKVTSFMKNASTSKPLPEKVEKPLTPKSKFSQFGFRSPKIERSLKLGRKTGEHNSSSTNEQLNANGCLSKSQKSKSDSKIVTSPKIGRLKAGIGNEKQSNGTAKRIQATSQQKELDELHSATNVSSDGESDNSIDCSISPSCDTHSKDKQKSPIRPRKPFFGIKDFFHRFSDKEKQALHSFDFLAEESDFPSPDDSTGVPPAIINGAGGKVERLSESTVESPENMSENDFSMSDTCAEDYQTD